MVSTIEKPVSVVDIDQEIVRYCLYIIEKELGRKLSPEQRDIVCCTLREILVAGGERAGKSQLGADIVTAFIMARLRLSIDYPEYEPVKLVWLYGAEYDETSQEYEYIIQNAHTLKIFKSAKKNWNPGVIELTTGTIIKTVSGQDETDIGREAPDFILVCEAAKISQHAFDKLDARLAEKRGRMLMTGTFEGSLGWYPQLFEEWQLPGATGKSFSLPTWSNLAIFPGGRDDPEIKRLEENKTPEFFMERFGGVPCPPEGLVFKEFRVDTHVKQIEVDPNYPVYLWVDPGYAIAYAVLAVQIINDRIYIPDEIYVRNMFTREVIQVCKTLKPWWQYVYPVGVMDVGGSQHHQNESDAEIWASTSDDGAGIVMQMEKVPIAAGTERLRDFLKPNPFTGMAGIVISPRCKGIISEFGGCTNPITGEKAFYQYPIKNGMILSEIPEDKNNHAIKAMIYGIVNKFGYATRKHNKVRSMKYGRRK